MADMIGRKNLKKEFNGELDAEDVDGKLLADLLTMLSDRFEGAIKCGTWINIDHIGIYFNNLLVFK
jgi:hypothetical protein